MSAKLARRRWVKRVGGPEAVAAVTHVIPKRVEQWVFEGFPPKKALLLRQIAETRGVPLDEDWINFDRRETDPRSAA